MLVKSTKEIIYKDLFSTDIIKMGNVGKALQRKLKIRQSMFKTKQIRIRKSKVNTKKIKTKTRK